MLDNCFWNKCVLCNFVWSEVSLYFLLAHLFFMQLLIYNNPFLVAATDKKQEEEQMRVALEEQIAQHREQHQKQVRQRFH